MRYFHHKILQQMGGYTLPLTEDQFIEELIACIKSDEAVTLSQACHPDMWAGADYAGKQQLRRAIARAVRLDLKKDEKTPPL